jgi:zinc protease
MKKNYQKNTGIWLLFIIFSLYLVTASQAAQLNLKEKLPVDPKIVFGELENGLTYWFRLNQTPPNQLGLRLHVNSGSLNEEENERGIAHFLEHLAFNGSENFKPGKTVALFESLGLRFGHHQNAFTSFDQTTYVMNLPDINETSQDKGFLFLADTGFRLSLLPEEIDKERRVILEEKRARKNVRQRLFEKMLPLVAPNSLLSTRLPIGIEKTINAADQKIISSFYSKWYTPNNTTLLICGDLMPERMHELVKKYFSDWPKASSIPKSNHPGIKPYTTIRAGVITDPELTRAEIRIISLQPLRDFKTIGDFREYLIDQLGVWILNRRFDKMIKQGQAPFQEAGSYIFPYLNTATYSGAAAYCKAEEWEESFHALILEINRARKFGFLSSELKDAAKAILADTHQASQTVNTWDSKAFLKEMNESVFKDRLPIGAGNEYKLTKELLPGIKVSEISKKFNLNFPSGKCLLVISYPEKEDLPAPQESELTSIYQMSQLMQISPPKGTQRLTSLMNHEPFSGKFIQQRSEPDLGITSITFDNGVRFHSRRMDYKRGEVFASINLTGGKIQEIASIKGLTEAATIAFQQPATSLLNSTQIQNFLTGINISLSVKAMSDRISFKLHGSPEDLETGLQLIYLLLTDAKIEKSALDRWKKQKLQEIAANKINLYNQLTEKVDSILTNNDHRFIPLTESQINKITVSGAQRWLKKLLVNGSIEAAIVGEIQNEEAIKLASTYLGSLSKRALTTNHPEYKRDISPMSGPESSIVKVDTITPRSEVILAWRSAEWTNVKDRRIIQMIAQIITSRLREVIREKEGLTYSISCFSRVSQAYQNTNFLGVYFTADPDKVSKATDLSKKVIEKFAAEGPNYIEMQTVRKQFRSIIDTSQKEPSYWVYILSDLDYHGTLLENVKNALPQYLKYSREQMQEVAKKYLTPANRLEVIVKPTSKIY